MVLKSALDGSGRKEGRMEGKLGRRKTSQKEIGRKKERRTDNMIA